MAPGTQRNILLIILLAYYKRIAQECPDGTDAEGKRVGHCVELPCSLSAWRSPRISARWPNGKLSKPSLSEFLRRLHSISMID